VISCQPIGSPKPDVTWYKGSSILGMSGDKYSVSNDGTLRINKVGKSDRGTYTCVGRNSFGVIKKDTYLMIKGIIYVFF
jgi:hypothetical protein